jgi:hypothetical protein
MKSTGMPLYKHSLESLNICVICVPTSQKSTYAQFKILKNQCYLCAEILKKWHFKKMALMLPVDFIFHISPRSGGERDSSGTTKARNGGAHLVAPWCDSARAMSAKVMERIARRAKGAARPNHFF